MDLAVRDGSEPRQHTKAANKLQPVECEVEVVNPEQACVEQIRAVSWPI